MTFFANEKKGLKRISTIVGSLSKRLNTIMSACSSDPLPLSPGWVWLRLRAISTSRSPSSPSSSYTTAHVNGEAEESNFLEEKNWKYHRVRNLLDLSLNTFSMLSRETFFHSRNVVRGAYGSICAGFVEGFPSQSFVPHEAPTSGNFLMNCGKATALHSTLVSLYFGRSAWHL